MSEKKHGRVALRKEEKKRGRRVQEIGDSVTSPLALGVGSAIAHQAVALLGGDPAEPRTDDGHPHTRLWDAASSGDVDAVNRILKDRSIKIDRDAKDVDGTTALHKACQEGHLAVAKLLLRGKKKANLDATFSDGGVTKSALDVALENGHSDVANYLKRIIGAADVRQAKANTPMQEYVSFRTERETQEYRDYLLKDYEGFLAPKLSDGAVEFEEHWEISDYRMRRGVDKNIHENALQNLGWNMSRYMTSLQEHAESSYQMEVAVLQVALNHETTLEKRGKDDFELLSAEEQEAVIKERWDFLWGMMKSTFMEDEEISWDEYLYIRRVRMLYGVSDDELKYHICQWCFVDYKEFHMLNDKGYTDKDKENAEKTPTAKTREMMLRQRQETEEKVFDFMKREWASCNEWYPGMLEIYNLGIGLHDSRNREPRFRDKVHTDIEGYPGQVKTSDNKPLLFAYKNRGSDSKTVFQEPHLKPWEPNAVVTKLPSESEPDLYTVEYTSKTSGGSGPKFLHLSFVQMQTQSDYLCLLKKEHVDALKWEITKKITSIVVSGSERDRGRNGTYDLVEKRRICNRPYFMTKDERNHLYFHEGLSRTDCKWVITSRRPDVNAVENPKKGKHYAKLQDSPVVPYVTDGDVSWESTDPHVMGPLIITPKGADLVELRAPTIIDPPNVAETVTVGGELAMQMNIAGSYKLRQYRGVDENMARLVCERPYYKSSSHHLYYDGEKHRWIITTVEPKVAEVADLGGQYLAVKDFATEPSEIKGRWDMCRIDAGRSAAADTVTLMEGDLKLAPKGVRPASQEKANQFDALATDFRRAVMALSWWYHATEAEVGDTRHKTRTKQKAFATQWQWWLAEHQRKVEARTRQVTSEVYVTDDEARMIKKRGIALAQRNRKELVEKKEKKKKEEEREKKEQDKLEQMITDHVKGNLTKKISKIQEQKRENKDKSRAKERVGELSRRKEFEVMYYRYQTQLLSEKLKDLKKEAKTQNKMKGRELWGRVRQWFWNQREKIYWKERNKQQALFTDALASVMYASTLKLLRGTVGAQIDGLVWINLFVRGAWGGERANGERGPLPKFGGGRGCCGGGGAKYEYAVRLRVFRSSFYGDEKADTEIAYEIVDKEKAPKATKFPLTCAAGSPHHKGCRVHNADQLEVAELSKDYALDASERRCYLDDWPLPPASQVRTLDTPPHTNTRHPSAYAH
jgi:hypothetical protein